MSTLDTLRAGVTRHKTALLGGAVAVVGALGYRAHLRSKQPGAATNPATGGTLAPTGAAVAGYSTPTADTTGTDVYNALEPQLQQTQTLLSQLIDTGAKTIPPATGGTPTHTTTGGTVHTGPTRGPVKPAPAPTHKSTPPRTYVVKKGDTLSGIAARYHLPWTTLYAHNKAVVGRNPNLIFAGQRLTIP